MKRLVVTGLLVVAACSVATSAFAQAVAKGKNELKAEVFLITAKPTGDADADRLTSAEFTTAYARFLTDRFAAGPLFRIAKARGQDATGYLGGLGTYYFGNLTKRAIPFAEVNLSRTLNEPTANYTDLQVVGGLLFPMGPTGGRFRIGPYYYRAFYDEAVTGYSSYQAIGVSWSVALLF